MRCAALALLLAVACTPHAVTPPPDATDAAPYVSPDGAVLTPCQAACTALAAAGCPAGTAPDCVTTMAHIDGSRQIAEPSGKPLSCVDLVAVKTKADALRLGVGCP